MRPLKTGRQMQNYPQQPERYTYQNQKDKSVPCIGSKGEKRPFEPDH